MERFLVFLAGAGFGAAFGRWLNSDAAYIGPVARPAPLPDGEEVAAVNVMARTNNLLKEIRALVVHAELPDRVLEERILAKVARLVARPEAVQVRVAQGKVALTGAARDAEVRALGEAVASMRGVKELENRLEPLTPPFTSWDDAEPGSRPPRGKPVSYSPSVSILLAAGGLAMAYGGYRMRGGGGALVIACGAALLGAGAAGFTGSGAFSAGAVSRLSESSSWRPGLKGSRSATSP